MDGPGRAPGLMIRLGEVQVSSGVTPPATGDSSERTLLFCQRACIVRMQKTLFLNCLRIPTHDRFPFPTPTRWWWWAAQLCRNPRTLSWQER